MRKTYLREMSLLLLMAMVTSCYHVTYSTGKAIAGPAQSGWSHFYLWGLAGDPELDLSAQCPNGTAKLHAYQSFANGLVGALTLGIYSPRSWEAWCTSKPSKK